MLKHEIRSAITAGNKVIHHFFLSIWRFLCMESSASPVIRSFQIEILDRF